MSRAARARWAISFADLSLLLLGFFVLLQANQATRDEALAGLNVYFAGLRAPHEASLSGDTLFAPGEALLSAAGRNALLAAAKPMVEGNAQIRLQSIGLAQGDRRFDAWDLSAARLGAVARALVAAGITRDRIHISGLAEAEEGGKNAKKGQIIRLAEIPQPKE